MSKILIILGSTRQGRQGEKVARWVYQWARQRQDLQCELADLRDWHFPFFDSAITPGAVRDSNYGSDLTNRWAQKIKEADGYILVTPEYNHGYSAVLKNALDQVYYEWNRKPVAFVGYSGGPVAGARAVQQLHQVAVELQMVPLRLDVLIPTVGRKFDEGGNMLDETMDKRLKLLFDQLSWWARVLHDARLQPPQQV